MAAADLVDQGMIVVSVDQVADDRLLIKTHHGVVDKAAWRLGRW